MYDIRQFKPALYVLVLLGITGFALASESPGTWVMATALILLNAWMVRDGLFRPVPRLFSNLVTLAATGVLCMQLLAHANSPLLLVGQFLVVLQVVKLWEQRANRDYAQLLVLSLLLMVAAAISTSSLLFGLMLIGYLVLSLYCCLLFHLKVETDEARVTMDLTDDAGASLLQDSKFMSRSMRRLTGLIAVFSVSSAVLTFLLFPRGTGAGMFGELRWKPRNTMTGFSEQVSLDQVAKITQNNEQVGVVHLWRGSDVVPGTTALLLRGATHDTYFGIGDDRHAAYSWGGSPESTGNDSSNDLPDPDASWNLPDVNGLPRFREEITLSPTGTDALFATAGPLAIRLLRGGTQHLTVHFNPVDRILASGEPLKQPIRYEVQTTGVLGKADLSSVPVSPSHIDPMIRQYARRDDVCGIGLLARRAALLATQPPSTPPGPTDIDEQIAQNIAHHLQSTFTYTLDLTNTPRLKGRDPVVAFLYDFKKGHCEYFAGAMTLMCQSLGMRSRLVVGFRCDDYNTYGNYFTIRQSQAHAWVEVLTSKGWLTFDPTSGREALATQQGLLAKTRHFIDFLEYTWANSVIAYDSSNRDNLINTVDDRITNSAIRGSTVLTGIGPKLQRAIGVLATLIVEPLVFVLMSVLIGAIFWFTWERWETHRRATRIGVENLPADDQARLLRQLVFYDQLLLLLEKRHIVRDSHQTPLEFSDSLSFLPSEPFSVIRRLTTLFYRIRYGHAELAPGQQRRLLAVIDRLEKGLDAPHRAVQ